MWVMRVLGMVLGLWWYDVRVVEMENVDIWESFEGSVSLEDVRWNRQCLRIRLLGLR